MELALPLRLHTHLHVIPSTPPLHLITLAVSELPRPAHCLAQRRRHPPLLRSLSLSHLRPFPPPPRRCSRPTAACPPCLGQVWRYNATLGRRRRREAQSGTTPPTRLEEAAPAPGFPASGFLPPCSPFGSLLTGPAGFKKNVNRATTQVMMKTGHVEKTNDRDYEVEER